MIKNILQIIADELRAEVKVDWRKSAFFKVHTYLFVESYFINFTYIKPLISN